MNQFAIEFPGIYYQRESTVNRPVPFAGLFRGRTNTKTSCPNRHTRISITTPLEFNMLSFIEIYICPGFGHLADSLRQRG